MDTDHIPVIRYVDAFGAIGIAAGVYINDDYLEKKESLPELFRFPTNPCTNNPRISTPLTSEESENQRGVRWVAKPALPTQLLNRWQPEGIPVTSAAQECPMDRAFLVAHTRRGGRRPGGV